MYSSVVKAPYRIKIKSLKVGEKSYLKGKVLTYFSVWSAFIILVSQVYFFSPSSRSTGFRNVLLLLVNMHMYDLVMFIRGKKSQFE